MRLTTFLRSPSRPFLTLSSRTRTTPRERALAGQSLIIFALANLVLMGALGLVLDGGYNVSQRRAMQNAADAAVLKGAQDVHLNATASVSTILTDVKAAAMQNGLPNPDDPATGASLDCRFVDNGYTELGPCGATIHSQATGVRVAVTERHRTFAMSLLGSPTSGVGASAVAHVEQPAPTVYLAGAGPFIVCGHETYLAGGGTLSILLADPTLSPAGRSYNPPRINPAAVGQTFLVHASSVASCGTLSNNRFDGIADQTYNANITIQPSGTTIKYNPGTAAGPMRQAVTGINGCDTVKTSGCVMLLPIADTKYVDCGTCKYINAVGWAAFLVTEVDANTHQGKLLSYEMEAKSTRTWTKEQNQSAVVIRLTR